MAKSFTFSNSTGVINLSSARENLSGFAGHLTIGLYPATSNTCTVEVTIEPDPTAAGAVWHEWDAGAVTVKTLTGLFAYPTGIRATRTAGSANGNVLIIHPY